jgi:hypothetical protein
VSQVLVVSVPAGADGLAEPFVRVLARLYCRRLVPRRSLDLQTAGLAVSGEDVHLAANRDVLAERCVGLTVSLDADGL